MQDEAIISTSSQASTAKPQQPKVGGRRSLEKTSWLQDSNAGGGGKTALEELEDSLENNQPFDQFKGKTTNYSDDIYSTKIDMSNVTAEQRQRALKAEQEIVGSATTNRHIAEERNQV